MTRTGKIARLPYNIRHELNSRLRDGQKRKTILQWLNALPETKALLEAEFSGRPIAPCNLTEWINGGYREWQTHQSALEIVGNLEDAKALGQELLDSPFLAKLAHWLALHYAAAARSALADSDPKLRWARLRELCADVTRLRRADLYTQRLAIDREWLLLEQSNSAAQREQDFWKWTETPEIRAKLFPDRQEGLSMETIQKIERELKLM